MGSSVLLSGGLGDEAAGGKQRPNRLRDFEEVVPGLVELEVAVPRSTPTVR